MLLGQLKKENILEKEVVVVVVVVGFNDILGPSFLLCFFKLSSFVFCSHFAVNVIRHYNLLMGLYVMSRHVFCSQKCFQIYKNTLEDYF